MTESTASRSCESYCRCTVLSELPVIHDAADDAREHRQTWFAWASTAVVVASILAGSAVSYLKG